MTRDEVRAVIDEMRHDAEGHDAEADAHARGGRLGMANLYLCKAGEKRDAARMLAEALEKSEAADGPVAAPIRREVRMPYADAIARGICYGAAWGEVPREVPEAGPGLWLGVAMWSDRGDTVLLVERVSP